ncbi:hypothetical protein LP421_21685 [Rhizobium sp. RCAM05350]|nr:hypothetical protein LP421_21685 [Rhizobium sp. RCAM05350]
MPDADDKITIESVTSPHHVQRVDRKKYTAMRHSLLGVLPAGAPGITIADAKAKLLQHLPEDLFPGGDKAGWWLKAVQLDLEAKRVIGRTADKPLRLFKHAD